MKTMRALVILTVFLAAPLWAVQPDEILPDAQQEARARVISKGLRCLVCRNENIDDSNAGLARDLRLLVRERIVAGDDDAEVLDFVVARYGEFVLLRPKTTGSNIALWAAGPVMLLLGIGMGIAFVRRRKGNIPASLSDKEKARLAQLLQD